MAEKKLKVWVVTLVKPEKQLTLGVFRLRQNAVASLEDFFVKHITDNETAGFIEEKEVL